MKPVHLLLAVALFATGATRGAGAPPGDAKRGERLFIQCRACHNVQDATAPAIGPSLAGVVGRRSAQLAAFKYSDAMRKANLRWDDATLNRFLEKPTVMLPGTAMIFAGLPKAEDRAAIIAYLKTLPASPPR